MSSAVLILLQQFFLFNVDKRRYRTTVTVDGSHAVMMRVRFKTALPVVVTDGFRELLDHALRGFLVRAHG